jgi:hypothetical protein
MNRIFLLNQKLVVVIIVYVSTLHFAQARQVWNLSRIAKVICLLAGTALITMLLDKYAMTPKILVPMEGEIAMVGVTIMVHGNGLFQNNLLK